jgi:hypothetical protein
MTLQVLVAMSFEKKKSCDTTPCSLVAGYYHFEGTYCYSGYRANSRFLRNDGKMYQLTLRHINPLKTERICFI